MNPSRPLATHVAVRDGRILGVGPLEELAGWGDYTLDDRFADKVLMPGFVEGHSHLIEGAFWRFVYCGWFDRSDPTARSGPARSRSMKWCSACSGPRPRWPTPPRRWPAGASTRSTSTSDADVRDDLGPRVDARGRWA